MDDNQFMNCFGTDMTCFSCRTYNVHVLLCYIMYRVHTFT